MFFSVSYKKLTMRIAATLLFAAITLIGDPVQAGKITGFAWTDGIVSIAGIAVTNPPPFPNNDDVVGEVNELKVLQKDYKGVTFIDIEFTVMDSGGVTEYAIIEGVQNNTGLDWSSYHVQLGFGTGADFVMSPSGDGLDFDAPFFDSIISFDPAPLFSFPAVAPSEDVIDADGGPGQPDFLYNEPFVFHIDVPDGITSFTLRQFPVAVVPEPSSIALLLLGLASLKTIRR